jgi:hypothetical protein
MITTQNKQKAGSGLLKKLVSAAASILIIGIVVFFPACENITGGAGGAPAARAVGQPIPIADQTQLELIGTDPDLYPASGSYILTASFSIANWLPICGPGTEGSFTGTFDGDIYTITIDSFSATALTGIGGLGIFAATDTGAVIQNLTVEFDAPINTGTVNYAGGVTGYANDTTFSNITVVADVSAVYTDTGYTDFDLGGVAGYAVNSTFTGISVSGTITASSASNYTYDSGNDFSVGGVAGYAYGGSISDSTSSAAITANSSPIPSFAGGIVGRGTNGLEIEECEGSGAISSNGRNNNTSGGGIAGYITQTTITDSYTSAGNITVTGQTGSGEYDFFQVFGGGLVGYAGSASAVVHCQATGQTVTTQNAAYPYAGGLVGYNYGALRYPNPPDNGSAILRSYSTNTVTADATDNGIPYAGGLAGYNSAAGSLIQDCYAWGNVNATTAGTDAWAGGVAGSVAAGSTLERAYAIGNVTATAGSGALPYPQTGIDDGASAGGVVGYAYNYYASQITTVQDSVGLNRAVTASGSSAANWAHRVVGHNGIGYLATITDNLGSTAMVLTPTPTTLDPDLDGANVTPPVQQTDFTGLGWNFNTTWYMNTTSGYPELY